MSKSNIPEMTSYAGAASSLGIGTLTMNDWAILVGILMAILTFLLNAWYADRRDKREQRLKEMEEQLKKLEGQELLARILAQGTKK